MLDKTKIENMSTSFDESQISSTKQLKIITIKQL